MVLVRYPFFSAEDWPKILEETDKLTDVLLTVQPDHTKVFPPGCKSKFASNKTRLINCNEVYPGVIIGDGATAMKKKYLKRIGVTHVVNAAMGTTMYMINTTAAFYAKEGIKFMGVFLEDSPACHIAVHFETVANFIDDALKTGGKVYVNCVSGISRSATFVIAFLMIKRFMTAESALRTLRSIRQVAPNVGFLAQLAALELKLREEHADYPRTDNNGIDQATRLEKTFAKKCHIL